MQNTRLTSADFDKMIIESIDEVMAYDRGTGELKFWFDQIKSGELTSDAEVVYAEGRQGVQLAAFDRNKTAGFTCENGYVLASAIATQLGSDVIVAEDTDGGRLTIQVQDYFVQASGTDTIKRTDGTAAAAQGYPFSAAPNTGTVKFVYQIGGDNSIVKKFDMSAIEVTNELPDKATLTADDVGKKYILKSTDTSGETPVVTYTVKEVYDAGTSELHDYDYRNVTITEDNEMFAVDALDETNITLVSFLVDADETKNYLAIYDTDVSIGKKIINRGDKFAGNVKLVINFVAQDPCDGNKYLMQAIMPNAKVSGSFSLSAGDDPAVQNFEATAMLDVCSIDKELFTIVMA